MVVGVVRSKLDAIKMSEATSDLPQNVNFATKSSVLIKVSGRHTGDPVDTTAESAGANQPGPVVRSAQTGYRSDRSGSVETATKERGI